MDVMQEEANKKEIPDGKALVSVIVPVYNVADYAAACIDSIVGQTYPHLEIILVDDGSTDLSGEICDKYGRLDQRIRVFHKTNGGLSDARNFGLEKSTGEYIYFVDSDDVLNINIIEVLYQSISENNLDMAASNYVRFVSEDEMCVSQPIIGPLSVYDSRSFMMKYFDSSFQSSVVVAWGKLYKRSLWENVRFPKGKIHEDEYTTYKLIYKSARIGYIDDKGYYYRKNNNSIMTSKNFEKHLDLQGAFCNYLVFFKEDEELYHFMLQRYMGFLIDMKKKISKRDIVNDLIREYNTCLKIYVSSNFFSVKCKFKMIVKKYLYMFP